MNRFLICKTFFYFFKPCRNIARRNKLLVMVARGFSNTAFQILMQQLQHKPIHYRIAAGILFFNQGMVFSSWATRIPDFKTSIGLSDAGLGSVLFALPMGQISVMFLSGWLVAKFSSVKVMRIAGFLYPAMLFSLLLADSQWSLFCCLFFFGISANLTNISINTQAIDVERIYGRSVMASFHGLWSFAGFCGGVLSAVLVANHIGILAHYVAINIFTGACLLFALPRLVPADIAPQTDADAKKSSRSFWWPTPFIMMLGAITFANMSCEGIMFDWSVIYFRDVIGTAADISRLGFISFMSAMATGRFVGDYFINKFGHMRVLKVSGMLVCAGMLGAIAYPTIYTGTIGFLLVGFGVSSVVPTCYSLAGRSRRMNASIALAVVSSIGFLGFLLFPPVIGFIAQASSLRLSFLLMAFVGVSVTLFAPKLRTHVEN